MPDPISGPRETGMAQASSSSGSAPAQALDPASHHGQASQGGPREHGPHLNNTPEFLSELEPPEDFGLRLSFNDHRFKAEIMTKEYLSRERKKSCSKSFVNDRSEWKQALAQVHRWAWTEWEQAKPEGNCRLIVGLVLSLRLFWNALPRLSTQCLRLQSAPRSCLFQLCVMTHHRGEHVSR